MVKYLIAGAVLLLSGSAVGAGYTNITSIESLTVVRDEGVMLEGDFGNPGGCTYGNSLFISINHSQYSLILEVVMRAYFQGNPIFAYVLRCSDVLWYALPGKTYNVVSPDTALGVSRR